MTGSNSAVTASSCSRVTGFTFAHDGGFEIQVRTDDGDFVARSAVATASGITTSL